jgi:hypothetical protein
MIKVSRFCSKNCHLNLNRPIGLFEFDQSHLAYDPQCQFLQLINLSCEDYPHNQLGLPPALQLIPTVFSGASLSFFLLQLFPRECGFIAIGVGLLLVESENVNRISASGTSINRPQKVGLSAWGFDRFQIMSLCSRYAELICYTNMHIILLIMTALISRVVIVSRINKSHASARYMYVAHYKAHCILVRTMSASYGRA